MATCIAEETDELASLLGSEWVQVSLTECPFFGAAVNLAREHRAIGSLPQNTYRVIAERSSQVASVSKALNAGGGVKGANLSIALIGALAEDFGGSRQ